MIWWTLCVIHSSQMYWLKAGKFCHIISKCYVHLLYVFELFKINCINIPQYQIISCIWRELTENLSMQWYCLLSLAEVPDSKTTCQDNSRFSSKSLGIDFVLAVYLQLSVYSWLEHHNSTRVLVRYYFTFSSALDIHFHSLSCSRFNWSLTHHLSTTE